jgi:PAS domain S-box-containing protein
VRAAIWTAGGRLRELASGRYFRRTALVAVPLLVLILTAIALLYRADRAATLERLTAEQRRFSSVLVRDVAYSLAQSVSDTSALADRAGRGMWLVGGATPAAVRDELRAFLEIGGRYRGVWLFDDRGRELVRTQDSGERAASAAVPPDLHQVVEAAIALPAGGLYVSRFDRSPTADATGTSVYIAAPVREASREAVGAIVLEFDGERLFRRLRTASAEAPGFFWMLDEHGGWLLGPESPAVEIEPALASAGSFADLAPGAWQLVQGGSPAGDHSADGAYVTYERLATERLLRSTGGVASILPRVVTAEPWILVGYLPPRRIDEAIAESRRRWGIVFATLMALVAVAAALAGRYWQHRREAAEVIASSEKRFRALLAAAPDAVVICDEAGRIVFFSEQAERLLGYTSAEILGELVDTLVPSSRREGHAAKRERFWREAREGSATTQLDVSARAKDGRDVPVAIQLSPVRTHEGSFVFCDLRDLTDAQQAEREIVELNTHLERRTVELSVVNDRLAARTHQLEAINRELEAFVYSAAHDLRTPLRGMAGFSRVLIEKYAPVLDERGRDYLGRVLAAAQRMSGLLDDLLRLSRLSRAALQRSSVDVSAMVREITAELQESSESREVTWAIEDGLFVEADAQLLRAALENLLGNAWKYSARRSRAEIAFGRRREDGEDVFFVRDNGVGFDPSYVHHLFRPFQRLHASSEFAGSGVGLALVQRIVHRHGGRIWAEAAVDRGATFHFTLGSESSTLFAHREVEPMEESA